MVEALEPDTVAGVKVPVPVELTWIELVLVPATPTFPEAELLSVMVLTEEPETAVATTAPLKATITLPVITLLLEATVSR